MSSPSSNAPPSPPLLDLNKPVQVEVFFPVDNNGVPIQINPDEFLEDDLMDEDELREQAALMDQDDQHFGIEEDILEAMNDNNQHDPAPHDQQLHLGFVELVEPSIDPIFEQFPPPKALPADLFRLWAKHFNSAGSSNAIDVPPDWAPFSTSALLNPESFAWAKRFLSSQAWSFFSSC